MTSITVRLDEKTKKKVNKIAKENGLDIVTAVKMFIAQIAKTNSIPLINNKHTQAPFRSENEVLSFLDEYADGVLSEKRKYHEITSTLLKKMRASGKMKTTKLVSREGGLLYADKNFFGEFADCWEI